MKKLNPGMLLLMALLVVCAYCSAQTAISNFGSNPGGIQAFEYVPANMPANAPLVLVLHGCTQTVSSYSMETQWNDLADRHKFYVCYGQQTSANNSLECFNYYVPGDVARGNGEALSLKQITDYMKANYSIDSTRVFVTGLSAGAAMTCVMCCTYPDVFSAGAEMSRLPYKCANSETVADEACLGLVSNTPQTWGNLARAGDPGYTGPWPRLAIFHGSSDETVSTQNDGQVIDQFTNLYGISQTPGLTKASFNANSLIQLEQWFDSTGHVLLEYYLISGMAHGTAVYPGTCYQQGGATDDLSFNEQFYSPFWAAQFFGILIPPYSMTGLINVSVNQAGLVYSVPYTAGSVYTWTVPPGATIVSGQGTDSVTVNWGTTSGTISVTEMQTGGCELGPVSLFVTASSGTQVIDAGLNTITNPLASICSTSFTPSFTLTNSGNITLTSVSINYAVDAGTFQNYGWTGSLAALQSTTVTLPTVSVSAGSHLLTIYCTAPNGGTDAHLSNDTVTKNFTAGVPPVVNLGSNVTQCGGSISLNAGNAGSSFSWSNGATSQTVSVTQSNTYTVTVTNAGCSASGSVNVTINTAPVVNLGSNVTQCGGSVSLNAQNAGGVYSWSNGASSQTVLVTQSNTYVVTVTSGACSATGSVGVTINPVPVINLAGGNFCASQTTLNAGNNGSTYHWSTTATTQSITVSATGSYEVTVTSAQTCTASATTNVNLNSNPAINLGPGGAFCGTDVILDAGNAGSTFLWSTGATTETISTGATGTYSVTVTGGPSCSSSGSVNIGSINPVPVVNLGSGGNICGNSYELDAGNTGSVFLWSTGATTETINATGSNTYIVTVTSQGNCSASASVSISLNTVPVVSLGNDTAICGGSLPLDAGNVGSTYNWSNGATTEVAFVNTTGTYAVTVTNVISCSASAAVNITVNPLPVVSLSWDSLYILSMDSGSNFYWVPMIVGNDTIGAYCIGGSLQVVLTGGSPSGGVYSGNGVRNNVFHLDSLIWPNGQQPFVDTITYTYINANNCTGSTINSVMIGGCNSGIQRIPPTNLFTLYPNPADDYVMIDFDGACNGSTVFVKDITGRQLFETRLVVSPQQIPTGNLPPGAYLVMLYKNGQVGARLLVKE